MDEMACQISGTVSSPIKLYTLVDTNFIKYQVLAFCMKATCLHELVDSNPKYMSEYEIIRTLNTKYGTLKGQGLWSPYEGKK